MTGRLPDPDFWGGRRVFLTGHTGFKGSWLAIWLRRLGAEVRGYALAPETTPSLFAAAGIGDLVAGEFADITDHGRLAGAIARFQPDVVIHMAAQSLVRRSYASPRLTFETNVLGTVNLLDAARATAAAATLIVTSDKCYQNDGPPRAFIETDRLGGHDPYSASKACAELAVGAYFRSFFAGSGLGLATARAGNVIGGGDWAADRLIPDLARAFGAGDAAVLRDPTATRPWQHVLEPLNGYLLAVEHISGHAGPEPRAWNFGPDQTDVRTVGAVAEAARAAWGEGARVTVARDPVARDTGARDAGAPREAATLSLDSALARAELGWHPRWPLDAAIHHTMAWYRGHAGGLSARRLCEDQIDAFIAR